MPICVVLHMSRTQSHPLSGAGIPGDSVPFSGKDFRAAWRSKDTNELVLLTIKFLFFRGYGATAEICKG